MTLKILAKENAVQTEINDAAALESEKNALVKKKDKPVVNVSGAYLEKEKKLVINAKDALENSDSAKAVSSSMGHTWEAKDDGIQVRDTAPGDLWDSRTWAGLNGIAPALQHKINISNAGAYYLWVNMSNPDDGADSYHVAVDGIYKYVNTDGQKVNAKGWYCKKEAISLSKGVHVITIFAREDGLTLNQLLFTQDANATFADGTFETPSRRYMGEESADFTDLQAAVDSAKTKVEAEYTAESWSIFASALQSAEEMLGNKDAAQKDVDAAQKALVKKDTPVIPEILADFNFDADGDFFGGGNAKAAGTYTLVDHGTGKALKLTGGEKQHLAVTAKDGSSLLTGVEELTVSFQIKPENSATNWGFFAAPNDEEQKFKREHYLGVVDISGTTSAERYNNSGERPGETASYQTGYPGWYHVTAVYTKDATILYINGKKVSEASSEYALADILGGSSVLYIGRANWKALTATETGEYATALIDNYKILSRAMTDEEAAKEAAKYVEKVEKVEKEALKAAIDTKVDAEDTYTAESWKVYTDALTAANAVYNKKDAAQEEVDAAAKTLTDAQKALTKKPQPPKRPFEDVDKETGDWYYEAVYYNFDRGIMNGINETHFAPLDNLARAQFAIILHNMEGKPDAAYEPKFRDVEDEQWYTDAIMWASSKEIVTGYTDGSEMFGWGDKILREQMAVMMYRYAKNFKEYDTSGAADFNNFTDAALVSDYAEEAVAWAVGNGIITGKDLDKDETPESIDPLGDASRAECAIIIQRFLEKYN